MNCRSFFSLSGCLLILFAIPAICQTTTKAAQKPNASSSQNTCGQENKSNAKFTLAGKITDADNKPLAKTKVDALPECKCSSCPDYPKGCSCCPDAQTAITDTEGRYHMDLQPGDYTVKVGDTKKHIRVTDEGKTADIKVKAASSEEKTKKKDKTAAPKD